MAGREVGRAAALFRYPVKSMAAERLSMVEVGWQGVVGDRRWAFVRGGAVGSGFPWLTIRDRAEMLRYRPWFVDADRPDASAVMVRTPSGNDLEVVDPALAAELHHGLRNDPGDTLSVIKQDRDIFDTMSLSLITTQSVAAVGTFVGFALDVQRFRPNLVVEAAADVPFSEDAWVGAVLRVGGSRCVWISEINAA